MKMKTNKLKIILSWIIPFVLMAIGFYLIGVWGIVGVLLFLTAKGLYKVYRMRHMIIGMFNYAGMTLKKDKFRPNLNKKVGMIDLFGFEKFKENDENE